MLNICRHQFDRLSPLLSAPIFDIQIIPDSTVYEHLRKQNETKLRGTTKNKINLAELLKNHIFFLVKIRRDRNSIRLLGRQLIVSLGGNDKILDRLLVDQAGRKKSDRIK